MVDVPRHRGNGNPLILLPDYAPDPELAQILLKPSDERTRAERAAVKNKYAYYSRASSAGKPLEDTGNLSNYYKRMTAIGLTLRPDLLMGIAAHAINPDENKVILNDLCEQAVEAAKASAAANTGTALHKLSEYVDLGYDYTNVPGLSEQAKADLAAYQATMHEHRVEMVKAEQFVVCDELRSAGTFDRKLLLPGHLLPKVGDIKTGNTAKKRNGGIELDEQGRPVLAHVNSVAVQLAVYANSEMYDPLTGARTPLEVDKELAVVIHLPQGTGTCTLHHLDIKAGWEAAHQAKWTREWQERRDLAWPV